MGGIHKKLWSSDVISGVISKYYREEETRLKFEFR